MFKLLVAGVQFSIALYLLRLDLMRSYGLLCRHYHEKIVYTKLMLYPIPHHTSSQQYLNESSLIMSTEHAAVLTDAY